MALGLAFAPGFLPLPIDAGLVSFALLLVGLGAYGVIVLRMSDEQWAGLEKRHEPAGQSIAA